MSSGTRIARIFTTVGRGPLRSPRSASRARDEIGEIRVSWTIGAIRVSWTFGEIRVSWTIGEIRVPRPIGEIRVS